MRYLHSVQLPSHCGLDKQYTSPQPAPCQKKKKASTQISLSLATYKDQSINASFCWSREDNTDSRSEGEAQPLLISDG